MNYEFVEINKDKDTHLIFKRVIQPSFQLEPLLEIYKGKLYINLLNQFISDCINLFDKVIFSQKKPHVRTLTNLLSTWMFNIYIDNTYIYDYFFSDNYLNMSVLEDTIKDFCKYDITITDIDSKINIVLSNLKHNYEQLLLTLNKYKESTIYAQIKNNYKITKEQITQKKINTIFFRFNIKLPFKIKDFRLCNIINNILIPNTTYNKLYTNFKINKDVIDNYIWTLLFRYQLLGSNNHQLAVLPNIMNHMNSDYGLNFECFASSINCNFPNYCSIYYDIEKHFGSMCNFFNIIPIKGTFGFNPPYQKDLIEKGIYKIFNDLKNTTEELRFIITIPIWDNYGKEIIEPEYKQTINYTDFDIIEKIKSSEYFKDLHMISKNNFTYIDYNFDLLKNKTIQNTYIIILANFNSDINHIHNYNYF